MNEQERLAAQPIDDQDLDILRSIRHTWEALDPVPTDLTDRVRFAMTVASLEAEVAQLVEDSTDPVGVRGSLERATSMIFETRTLSLMIEVEDIDQSHADLTGWCSLPNVEIEVRQRYWSQFAHADTHGRFEFPHIDRGLVHIVVRTRQPGSPTVITPAIEL